MMYSMSFIKYFTSSYRNILKKQMLHFSSLGINLLLKKHIKKIKIERGSGTATSNGKEAR
jgi:hypothetical protein